MTGKEDLIELHVLPPYAHQLKALQCVWKRHKRAITHHSDSLIFQDLEQAFARRLTRFQEISASLGTANHSLCLSADLSAEGYSGHNARFDGDIDFGEYNDLALCLEYGRELVPKQVPP